MMNGRWRLHLVLVMALLGFACAAQQATLVFNDTICDLGRITVDSGYHHCRFEFTNQGVTEVTIIGALSACGCTVPIYPKEPIAPGAKGVVTVTYDSTGRPEGEIDKTITLITTGNPSRIRLYIQGEAFSLFNPFR